MLVPPLNAFRGLQDRIKMVPKVEPEYLGVHIYFLFAVPYPVLGLEGRHLSPGNRFVESHTGRQDGLPLRCRLW